MIKLSRLAAFVAASMLSTAGAVGIALNTATQGHVGGSSSSSSGIIGATGVVPPEQAARVLVYGDLRNWYTVDGRILICPFEFVAEDSPKKCYAKNDKEKVSRWTYFEGYKHLPGYEVSGIDYRVGRYERFLTVYFRKEGAK